MRIQLNPQLSAEDTARLFRFITAYKDLNTHFFVSGINYVFEEEDFAFASPMLSQLIGEEYRCDFTGAQLGKGFSGTVYAISQTFFLSPTEIRQPPEGEPQVLKIQQHCGCATKEPKALCERHNSRATATNEYEISCITPHLMPLYPPLFEGFANKSYLIFNRLPGRDLFDVIYTDYYTPDRLTIDQRMKLTAVILIAYQQQVRDRNIIHHDIKPENILVCLDPLSALICDFAFGSLVPEGMEGLIGNFLCGSVSYMPLELFTDPCGFITFKRDIFALVRGLVLLWGGHNSSYDEENMTRFKQMRFLRSLSSMETLPNLFKILPPDHNAPCYAPVLKKIERLFLKMLHPEVEKRSTIEEAREEFSDIYNEYERISTPQVAVRPVSPRAQGFFGGAAAIVAEAAAARPASPAEQGFFGGANVVDAAAIALLPPAAANEPEVDSASVTLGASGS